MSGVVEVKQLSCYVETNIETIDDDTQDINGCIESDCRPPVESSHHLEHQW